MVEHKAGEVSVQSLVPGDELVGEGQAGHEAALLEPEDCGEGAGEEDALDAGVGHDALAEGGLVVRDPLEGPVGLLAHGGHGVQGVEETLLLGGVLRKKGKLIKNTDILK